MAERAQFIQGWCHSVSFLPGVVRSATDTGLSKAQGLQPWFRAVE